MKVTSEDGTTVEWYDFGGNGPDLLLAHATGFCGRIWEPIAELLSNDFRCVSYDLRGHGLSQSPATKSREEGWHWQRYADDAIAVIEAADMANPFGVGHSCGGATEVLVEERNPGTFRSLYLFEPVIFTEDPPLGPDPERDLAVRTRKRRTTFESRDAAINAFSSKGPFATLNRAVLEKYVDFGFELQPDGTLNLRCDPQDEAEVYVMASAHEGYQRLDEVKCRTIVARGNDSNAFSEPHMQAITDRLPDSEFVQWPGMGHFGPLEQPADFADAVRRAFL